MILYHGSNEDILEIDLSKSRLGKDFGVGFYLTPDQDIARRQAERKYIQLGCGKVNVCAYNWDESGVMDLQVLRFDGYTIEWANFILKNRQNKSRVNLHQYDIVIGPIADDTIGFQIRRFQDGIISIGQFMEEIKYHHVTMQYMFATEQAIATLLRL